MASRNETLQNVQKYAQKISNTEYHADTNSAANHEARLEKTLNELNTRLEKERAALEDVGPS